MKKTITLLLLSFSLFTYSQEGIVLREVEDVEVVEKNKGPIPVPFAVVENAPIYKGCDESLKNSELKKCTSDAINVYIDKKFDTKIINKLELPDGKIKIYAVFKFDTTGKVIDVKSRASHPELEAEAIRVIESLPKMKKPGYQRGKAVIVPYSLSKIFNIKDKQVLKNKE